MVWGELIYMSLAILLFGKMGTARAAAGNLKWCLQLSISNPVKLGFSNRFHVIFVGHAAKKLRNEKAL